MFSLAMITQNTVFLNDHLDNMQQNFAGTILNMTSLALLNLMFFKFSIPLFFRSFVVPYLTPPLHKCFVFVLCHIYLLLVTFHTPHAFPPYSSTCLPLGSAVSCVFSFLLTTSVCRSHIPVPLPSLWCGNT